MHVGLLTARRQVELVEVAEPLAAPGVAVVDVSRCGVCGSDVHAFQTGEPYPPSLFGHEWSGVVRAVGEGVDVVVPGQRVVGAVLPVCGRCPPCRRGQVEHCATAFASVIGLDPLAPPHGAFAPRMALDAAKLAPVPDGVDDDRAALVEPATVALHAVSRTGIAPGDLVVVVGAGPIGLLALQCAALAGAARVAVVEPDAGRRAVASLLGADPVLGPEDASAWTLEASGGMGADVVLECAGVPATVQTSVDLLRRGGTLGLVGVAPGSATIAPATWVVKEVRVVASMGYLSHEFRTVMDLVAADRLRLAPLHTRTVPLSDLGAAMGRLADRPDGDVKVLVDPAAT